MKRAYALHTCCFQLFGSEGGEPLLIDPAYRKRETAGWGGGVFKELTCLAKYQIGTFYRRVNSREQPNFVKAWELPCIILLIILDRLHSYSSFIVICHDTHNVKLARSNHTLASGCSQGTAAAASYQ